MAKKVKVETPPSMLGIMRFNVDTTKLRLDPKTVLGIAIGFVLLVIILQIAVPLQ